MAARAEVAAVVNLQRNARQPEAAGRIMGGETPQTQPDSSPSNPGAEPDRYTDPTANQFGRAKFGEIFQGLHLVPRGDRTLQPDPAPELPSTPSDPAPDPNNPYETPPGTPPYVSAAVDKRARLRNAVKPGEQSPFLDPDAVPESPRRVEWDFPGTPEDRPKTGTPSEETPAPQQDRRAA